MPCAQSTTSVHIRYDVHLVAVGRRHPLLSRRHTHSTIMAPIFAAVLLPAAMATLMVIAPPLLLSGAAAAGAPPPAPAPIGQPGCSTTCGNVSVPYPFGFGPSHCYWPGLNLTCDNSDIHHPRLLLGDGSLRVAEISLKNQTVRVMRTTGPVINTTGDLTSRSRKASLDLGRGFKEHGYLLSTRNDIVVSGCNVMATVSSYIVEQGKPKIVGGCASFCTWSDDGNGIYGGYDDPGDKYCTGTSGCCAAPLTLSGVPMPDGVRTTWLNTSNHTADQTNWPGIVYILEHGWVNRGREQMYQVLYDGLKEAPLLLDFGVTQDLPPRQDWSCSQDVQRMICKSEHSNCIAAGSGYACQCDDNYKGNPYLADGCQDVDECKFSGDKRVCFGVCINTIGSYVCQCPQGTYGDPGIKGGCVNYNFNKDTRSTTVSQGPTVMMPSCNTTCGNVTVPYPFGFGLPGCYWPGLNLTCDTRHSTPRLLLRGDGNGNSTLEVIQISLRNSTVRVIHHHGPHGSNYWADVDNSNLYTGEVRLPDIGEPYVLSTKNEFIVFSGHKVNATLHGEYRNGSSNIDSIISEAVCSSIIGMHYTGHAPISAGSRPKRVEFKGFDPNVTSNPLAFISELGLTNQWNKILSGREAAYISSPIVLQWTVKQGLPAPAADNSGKCPGEVVNQLCKSDNSDCRQEINGGFTCQCSKGYDGNPYVADGCKDIDECMIPEIPKCLGGYYCNNLPGRYECRRIKGFSTGLIIGSSVASVSALLLVPGILFLLRKFKQRRIKLQKQKYFKQNRGQLLQQLLSQKADIAERMIIPLDELGKATNNFDRAREIGGGGHGTVYKGILSDLHVVAIKKSKVTKQKEIDEFINEVAILSQINHKNVVKLFGCCLETEVPLLVYEFIPNGTLYHHLHIEEPERSLSWRSRLRIATEIAASLAYLHSSVSIPIIHRDIKSSNILLDDTMTSKISDFGASRYVPIDNTGLTTRIQGTFGYLDPECFQTGRLTEKSDVYSFGVILVELLTRKKPTCPQLSNEYGGLVPHFLNLLASGNLVQIMDPQVLEEGGTEVQEVIMLAASCINLKGEERPTMRQVEITLEGLQQGSNKKYKKDDMVTEEFRNGSIGENYASGTGEGWRFEESSRRYSLEQDMNISGRYPR